MKKRSVGKKPLLDKSRENSTVVVLKCFQKRLTGNSGGGGIIGRMFARGGVIQEEGILLGNIFEGEGEGVYEDKKEGGSTIESSYPIEKI